MFSRKLVEKVGIESKIGFAYSLELLVKARFFFLKSKKPIILIRVFDMFRIGIAYGLFSEGLKLL